MNGPSKRDRLVDSAAFLFHRQGLVSTSLADIAKHSEIPIGNVYYYFKTKDELALAALEKRRRAMGDACAQLDAAVADPRERLMEMARLFERLKEEYTRYGCPVYRMIVEGGEVEKANVARAAAAIYEDFTAWAEKEFRQLGHEQEARAHAFSLLARLQGAVVVAKSFSDPEIFMQEIERVREWLLGLPNRRIFLGKTGVKKPETV